MPRIEHCHEPQSCQCDQCNNALIKIGEDVTEYLPLKPAKFSARRHIRPHMRANSCETVSAEPVPLAVVDGGMAAPDLLAVISNKYLNHLPFFRLEQIAAREQVIL